MSLRNEVPAHFTVGEWMCSFPGPVEPGNDTKAAPEWAKKRTNRKFE